MKEQLNDLYIRNYNDPDKRIEIYDTLTSGLAVRITPRGSKSFVYRYQFKSKVKRYTIGGRYPKVGLARARQLAGELAEKVANGIDPMVKKTPQADNRRKNIPVSCL